MKQVNTRVENPAIEAHDLSVSYQRKPALWGVDFTLPQGSITGIIGPNGAGKSTLIKAIMGLIPTGSGHANIMGRRIEKARDLVSYVPQRESVDWDFPTSVYDVVMMGRYGKLGFFSRPKLADHEVVKEALAQVEMSDYKSRQISQLSGGQQQRVFIARALAQQAEVYFMDEPFAGVDAATEKTLIDLFRKMAGEGKTLVVVHHDLNTVKQFFDWVLMLNTRMVACGPVDKAYTLETLTETYGGKLSVLSQVGELMAKGGYPTRDRSENG